MAIFIFDEKLKKLVPLEEYRDKESLNKPKISNYINMRNTLAKSTKIELSESTVEESAEKMRNSR